MHDNRFNSFSRESHQQPQLSFPHHLDRKALYSKHLTKMKSLPAILLFAERYETLTFIILFVGKETIVLGTEKRVAYGKKTIVKTIKKMTT